MNYFSLLFVAVGVLPSGQTPAVKRNLPYAEPDAPTIAYSPLGQYVDSARLQPEFPPEYEIIVQKH
jgi:hypothetical protein